MKKRRLNQKERQRQAQLARGFFLFIPLCLFFFSCKQDPIFYNISQEVKPKDPEIPGSPTKIVEAGSDLYVSNGRALYRYDGSRWTPIDKPPGTISDLAAAGSTLYAITGNNSLYRSGGSSWDPVPLTGTDYTFIQNIYGTDSTLYICVSSPGGSANKYTILSSAGGSPRVIKSGDGEGFRLKGAVSAGGDYIATGNGVYSASDSSTAVQGSTGYTIMGIIALPDNTMAVSTKDGSILFSNGSSFTAASLGITFDRAMATYKTASGWLLLVGVYTKGYVELELSSNGSRPASTSSHAPGQGTYGQNTTVHDNAQYSSSLGVRSLIGLYQSQRGERVLFASTQQKGLWAYQQRSEGWQWNAY